MYRQRHVLILLLLCFMLGNLQVSANTLPTEKPPLFINFCDGAETPADKHACTQKRFNNAEVLLNQQFDYFLMFLNDTQYKENMKAAQNSWIQYRNDECAFEAAFFEEEIAKRTLELSCLSRLTEERTLVLYNFIPRIRIQNQKEPR